MVTATASQGTWQHRCKALAVIIIDIDHGAALVARQQLLEEVVLAGEVTFHILVIVEVLRSQVGKDANLEVHTIDPVLVQRMGRDFHDQ